MKPVRILIILLLILLCFGALRSMLERMSPLPKVSTEQENFHPVMPEAHAFRALENSPVHEAVNAEGRIIGYAFSTRGLAHNIQGYGGPIHLLISLTPDKTIRKILIEEHQETPGFMNRISALLEQFSGKPIEAAFIAGSNIDGITGATVTSDAIIAIVNAAAQITAPVPSPQKRPSKQRTNPDPAVAILTGLFLFLITWLSCVKRKRVLRWAALFSGFAVLGILTQNMLSGAHVAGIVLFQVPSWNNNPLWYVLMIGAVAFCLAWGRTYCSGVCPFGFVEEILYKANASFFRKGLPPDQKTDAVCRLIKYMVLIAVIALCLYSRRSGIGAAEPYITLFTRNGSFPAWMLVLTVVIGSFFFQRFWCRYLCPFGAFLAMTARMRLTRRRTGAHLCADPSECFSCDQCHYPKDTQAAGKKQTLFFILTLTTALVFFSLSINTAMQATPQAPAAARTLNVPDNPRAPDSSAIKKQLRDAGVIPHPAKYWRVLDNE